MGACYKGKLPHFKTSVKLRIFYTHIDLFEEKFVFTLFTVVNFGPKKTHFRAGRHENKEKRLFYFDLRILMPIQIK
jgi:hypothetical protein